MEWCNYLFFLKIKTNVLGIKDTLRICDAYSRKALWAMLIGRKALWAMLISRSPRFHHQTLPHLVLPSIHLAHT
jgi:hypothetical protein